MCPNLEHGPLEKKCMAVGSFVDIQKKGFHESHYFVIVFLRIYLIGFFYNTPSNYLLLYTSELGCEKDIFFWLILRVKPAIPKNFYESI